MTSVVERAQAFLVPLPSSRETIVKVALAAADENIEHVDFPEGGGSSDLGLAIPYLSDMDDVIVDEAQLTIRAIAHPVTVEADVSSGAGSTIIDLHAPSRLVAIDIALATPLVIKADPPPPAATTRILLSTAEPSAVQAPIFAYPPPPPPSGLYPTPLAGMSASATSGAVHLTFDRPVAGSRWALQVASGDTAGELVPVGDQPITVDHVDVDAAPTGLTVVIPGDEGAPEATLYANPGILLPEADAHQIVFTPLAQRHLQGRLAAARESHDEGLLGVPLRLTSTSAGAVEIVSRTLRARYTVDVVPDPPRFATGGEWADLPLALPARRRPTDGAATFVVTTAGRELDPAFGPPPRAAPSNGVVVASRRQVAMPSSMTIERDGPAALSAVRLLVAVDRPAEAVLELHGDNAGLPGPIIASVVRKVSATTAAWQDFPLATPVDLPAPARVWCVLRTNDEPVRWFCASGGGSPLLSVDDGASWGAIAPSLDLGGAPLIQLFRPTAPDNVPILECHLGTTRVAEIELVAPGGRPPAATLAMPAQVLDAIGAATGTGRVTTTLSFYSRTVMQVDVRGFVCSYDPFTT